MSVEIYLNGFDGQPLLTNSLVAGRVRVKLKKPEDAQKVTQVLFAFYGQSSVHLTRYKLVTTNKYSSHHRFQLNGTGSMQPRSVGPRSEWTTRTYESQCLLFTHRHILLHSSFHMPAAGEDCALDFPFEIRIPTHSEPQSPGSIAGHACECFSASGCFPGSLGYEPPHEMPRPQPLPDSVYRFEDTFAENTKGTAYVRYTMHAMVPDLAGSSRWIFGQSGPLESTIDVRLVNPVSLPSNAIQYKTLGYQDTVRTMRLLHSHQEKWLSFRDNMRRMFKRGHLPWLTFGVVLQVPHILFLDQPEETKLPFSLGVRRLAGSTGETTGPPPLSMPGVPYNENEHPLGHPDFRSAQGFMKASSGSLETPEVYLKSLKLKLVAHTALRGGYDRFSGFGPKRFEGITPVTFFKFKASSSTPQVELPVGENSWTDLGSVLGATLGELRSAGSEAGLGGITGEFLDPNVWSRYGIDWEVRLECAGEEIHWVSETLYGGGLGIQFLRGDGAVPRPSAAQAVPPGSPSYSKAR